MKDSISDIEMKKRVAENSRKVIEIVNKYKNKEGKSKETKESEDER